MSELDEYGRAANRPIKPDQWAEFFKGAPQGRYIGNGTIPPGMLVIQNFLDPYWCATLTKECEQAIGDRHRTGVLGEDGQLTRVVDENRTSEAIPAKDLSTDIIGQIRNIYSRVVEPHYKSKIEWFETPEVLRYREGGEYKVHSDSHNWDAEKKVWKQLLDRDLSILLYINSDFEGGEVVFPNCDFGLKPRQGMLITFPSDWRYIHRAMPVTSGVRYAVVSWAKVVGSPRVNSQLPPLAIRM